MGETNGTLKETWGETHGTTSAGKIVMPLSLAHWLMSQIVPNFGTIHNGSRRCHVFVDCTSMVQLRFLRHGKFPNFTRKQTKDIPDFEEMCVFVPASDVFFWLKNLGDQSINVFGGFF